MYGVSGVCVLVDDISCAVFRVSVFFGGVIICRVFLVWLC